MEGTRGGGIYDQEKARKHAPHGRRQQQLTWFPRPGRQPQHHMRVQVLLCLLHLPMHWLPFSSAWARTGRRARVDTAAAFPRLRGWWQPMPPSPRVDDDCWLTAHPRRTKAVLARGMANVSPEGCSGKRTANNKEKEAQDQKQSAASAMMARRTAQVKI